MRIPDIVGVLAAISVILWFARSPLPGLRDIAILVKACNPSVLLEAIIRLLARPTR